MGEVVLVLVLREWGLGLGIGFGFGVEDARRVVRRGKRARATMLGRCMVVVGGVLHIRIFCSVL